MVVFLQTFPMGMPMRFRDYFLHAWSPVVMLLLLGCNAKPDDQDDACLYLTCSSHGTCIVVANDPACQCDQGYHAEGLSCVEDDPPGPCFGVTCSEHGQCIESSGEAICQCYQGYHAEGLACLLDPDLCAGVTCSGHGTCRVTDGQPVCVCDLSYHPQKLECLSGDQPCPEGYCSPEDLTLAQQLYGECSGDSYWPICLDRSCVEAGEEEAYLSIAEDVLLGLLGGDVAYLDAHFKLTDVNIISYSSDPPSRGFRVSYIFINDWVRIPVYAEVVPIDPFDETHFRDALQDYARGFPIKRKVSRPIPYSTLEEYILSCQGTIAEINWCFPLLFSAETGNMLFRGVVGTIDYSANQCAGMDANLESGDSTCLECPCYSPIDPCFYGLTVLNA